MQYTEALFEQNKAGTSYGRVLNYDHYRGYGFIRTEDGADLFLSSYNIADKDSKKLAVGTIVSFVPKKYKDGYTAADVKVRSLFPSGKTIELPTGHIINLKHLKTFGCERKEGQISSVYFAMRKTGEFVIRQKDLDTKYGEGQKRIADYFNDVSHLLLSV